MIPMLDLKQQYQALKAQIDRGIHDVLDSGRYILGPNVEAFEAEAAKYLSVQHAIGVANGTDALQLALALVDLKPGDEVITTAFTFFATAEAICYFGAKPVLVDIEPDTFNIDVKHAARMITPRTRAILPVHLFGKPADMGAIMTLAETHRLAVIEDCAQSFGATYRGKQTGSFGLAGCFSFFPTKNLGCYGDGGMVVTNSADAAAKIRKLRNHGSAQRYYHDAIGYNSRLDEIQAVILRTNLKQIDRYNTNRRAIAKSYREGLADLRGIAFQAEVKDETHVFHQFTLLHERRDHIRETLAKSNIASEIYYPIPVHRQKVFAGQYPEALPVCERVAATCLSLPIFPEMTKEQIAAVISGIKSALV